MKNDIIENILNIIHDFGIGCMLGFIISFLLKLDVYTSVYMVLILGVIYCIGKVITNKGK